jgi:hypothetical protein
MSLVAHPISQPSIDVSPIWTPIIEEGVSKIQFRPFKFIWECLECSVIMSILCICSIYLKIIGIYLSAVRFL